MGGGPVSPKEPSRSLKGVFHASPLSAGRYRLEAAPAGFAYLIINHAVTPKAISMGFYGDVTSDPLTSVSFWRVNYPSNINTYSEVPLPAPTTIPIPGDVCGRIVPDVWTRYSWTDTDAALDLFETRPVAIVSWTSAGAGPGSGLAAWQCGSTTQSYPVAIPGLAGQMYYNQATWNSAGPYSLNGGAVSVDNLYEIGAMWVTYKPNLPNSAPTAATFLRSLTYAAPPTEVDLSTVPLGASLDYTAVGPYWIRIISQDSGAVPGNWETLLSMGVMDDKAALWDSENIGMVGYNF